MVLGHKATIPSLVFVDRQQRSCWIYSDFTEPPIQYYGAQGEIQLQFSFASFGS